MHNKDEIITHILNRDKIYFSNLYSIFEHALFNVAFRLTRCEVKSETLLSCTFKQLWDTPSHFQRSDDKSIFIFLTKRLLQQYQERDGFK
ncbi:hypothetical protein [Peribacillus sp. SI8-4]|uniref:hypothetical protein n=1 Tax=Peribacillus sp. SI8-4 TaxID=3048009 RepID=UPI002554F0D8|nr:hypothetical protein [Peribacillus sp. SI8-4]